MRPAFPNQAKAELIDGVLWTLARYSQMWTCWQWTTSCTMRGQKGKSVRVRISGHLAPIGHGWRLRVPMM